MSSCFCVYSAIVVVLQELQFDAGYLNDGIFRQRLRFSLQNNFSVHANIPLSYVSQLVIAFVSQFENGLNGLANF
jgi:hypothetical protein